MANGDVGNEFRSRGESAESEIKAEEGAVGGI